MVAPLFVIVVTISSSPTLLAADVAMEVATLKGQKQKLEAELKAIEAKLLEMEFGTAHGKASDHSVSPIDHFITAFGVYDVDSAGGVEPTVDIVNPNRKSPIKYFRVTMQLHDRVGGIIKSTTNGSSTAALVYTGPIAFGEGAAKARWNPTWYNHAGWCVRVVSVSIEFLDGTRRSFSGRNLEAAMKPGLGNSCPPDGPRHRE